jgi:hypothetical protein
VLWFVVSLAFCSLLESAYYTCLVMLLASKALPAEQTWTERFLSWFPTPWFAIFAFVGVPAWIVSCVLQCTRFGLKWPS